LGWTILLIERTSNHIDRTGFSFVAFRHIGPYSKLLRTAPLLGTIDGRSAIGRLIRDLEEQLFDHIGGRKRATITQKLLIDRLIRIRLRLDAFDKKLDADEWTDLDGRTYGGLQNAYRLCIRELGAPAKAPTVTLADHITGLSKKGRAA
jgi:hypothetical protein